MQPFPERACGGCRAGLSAPGAMVAHSMVCCVCGIFTSGMYSALIGGLLPSTSCSVVGLRWKAGVSRACVPSMVSCSCFGLPIHAQPLRLFVTHRDFLKVAFPMAPKHL